MTVIREQSKQLILTLPLDLLSLGLVMTHSSIALGLEPVKTLFTPDRSTDIEFLFG
jgi:hypothetical protein